MNAASMSARCAIPKPTPDAICPVNHENWPKGGCTAMMPTCAGARSAITTRRESAEYKTIYNQRTADERINSQALALGIERPHLRAKAPSPTRTRLIYVLINLRALQRIRQPQGGTGAPGQASLAQPNPDRHLKPR